MVFLSGLVFGLLVQNLLGMPAIHNPGALPDTSAQIVKTEASGPIQIPGWVTHIPVHCFVGISRPCRSIEEARQQAIDSAVSQILQGMGAQYSLSHESTLSGNADYSSYELREQLTFTSRWFMNSIQQSIKESKIQKVHGRYIYFVLVDFPPRKIERLRRLTVGPKLTARIVNEDDNRLIIEVRETNGVKVVLTDYNLRIKMNNRHAGIITLFAWKVPESSKQGFEGAFNRKISMKNCSQTLYIPNPIPESKLKHIILGTESHMRIELNGYDEIGRQVSVTVKDL